MFLEVLALSPARQAPVPTQPPSLRVLHTPNLSPPLGIPRLRLTGENELHLPAGHEAICLLLWNPGEIKSGQSTVIYLMYFWDHLLQIGVKSLQGGGAGHRVPSNQLQVSPQAGRWRGGRRGGHFPHLRPMPVPFPTSQVLPPNLGSRKLEGSFLPHLTLEATEKELGAKRCVPIAPPERWGISRVPIWGLWTPPQGISTSGSWSPAQASTASPSLRLHPGLGSTSANAPKTSSESQGSEQPGRTP